MKTTLFAVALAAFASSAGAVELDAPRPSRNPAGYVAGGITDWIGFAATPTGRVFQTAREYPTEEGARQAARVECERTTGRTCPPEMTISIGSDFDVVAIICKNGARQGTYFGASKLGEQDDFAMGKARKFGAFAPRDCRFGPRY